MKLQQASTTWGICLAIGLRLIFLLDPRSRWPIGKEILESCRVCSSRAPSSSSARLSTDTAPCEETKTILKGGGAGGSLWTFLGLCHIHNRRPSLRGKPITPPHTHTHTCSLQLSLPLRSQALTLPPCIDGHLRDGHCLEGSTHSTPTAGKLPGQGGLIPSATEKAPDAAKHPLHHVSPTTSRSLTSGFFNLHRSC